MSKATDLIKQFEGLKFDAYLDAVGRPTIGYGTATKDIKIGMIWTQEQCEEALTNTVASIERQIGTMLHIHQNENQMAALIDFAYNLGVHALSNSTLMNKINNCASVEDCAAEFLRWDHAGGHVLAGLTRRRQAEHDLYLT